MRKNFLLGSLIALTALCSSMAFATSFQFPNFSGATAAGMLTHNGVSAMSGSNLRVVRNVAWEAGSAWYYTPVTLAANKAFSTAFAFSLTGGSGSGYEADGIVFCMHNDPRGTAAIGEYSMYLGYGGAGLITKSSGVEFDLWNNSAQGNGDNSDGHIGINTAGSVTSHTLSSTYDFTNNGTWYTWIDYDGTTLEVRVSQTDTRPTSATLSYAMNLNTTLGSPATSQAYVGFTASTGGYAIYADVLRWRFVDSYWPMTTTQVPALTSAITYAVYDPGNTKKKAIPGEDMVTTLTVTNSGGQPFADSVTNVMNVPTNLAFKVGSVSFTANTSGLTCCGTAGNVLYSSTGTSGPWTYTPTGTYDSNVKAIKYTPTGTMATGHSTPVSYSVSYTAQIQ